MSNISGKEVTDIIQSYRQTKSILKTAEKIGVSTVKVRKVLITEGLWESDTSRQIGILLNQGLTSEQIADKLYMSIKNVQAYMPYERGVYGGEEQSQESMRASRYRKRMKMAAANQIAKSRYNKQLKERVNEMAHEEKNELDVQHKEKCKGVLKLHLELDMEYVDQEERDVLRRYASMKNSISRDILVPPDITLHALNYAILRMFGWQNGHLHHFKLPQDVFDKLTENNFETWSKMAGVYFRFPTEDYDDIYWDDDYTEGQSVKSWMRKKYTGPYKYKGLGEHYLNNQVEVQRMFSRHDEIIVRDFIFGAEKQPDPYKVKLKDAKVEEVIRSFADVFCHELLERLPLVQILRIPGAQETDFAQVRSYLNNKLSTIDIDEMIEDYEYQRFKSMKQEREYLEQYDISVLPVTDQLQYCYDYGDGWEVLIRCDAGYQVEETGKWIEISEKPQMVSTDDLNEVIAKHKPVCVAKDGIELVDDVGGIAGFCRMLRAIYECDIYDDEELDERDSMLDWAEMMGWTGRRISPKQTL